MKQLSTCRTCQWFDPVVDDRGFCRFHSKVSEFGDHAKGTELLWPMVRTTDSCQYHSSQDWTVYGLGLIGFLLGTLFGIVMALISR